MRSYKRFRRAFNSLAIACLVLFAGSVRSHAQMTVDGVDARTDTKELASQLASPDANVRQRSAEALAKVRAPMGLDIGADSPAEIAISVLAAPQDGGDSSELATADVICLFCALTAVEISALELVLHARGGDRVETQVVALTTRSVPAEFPPPIA